MAVLALPLYPSAKTRSSLSPSQLATLNSKISGTLHQTLTLPPEKRDTRSIIAFVSAYAKDRAQSALESLIWDPDHASKSSMAGMSQAEKGIHQRVLLLAEKFATNLDIQTVVDICVVYARGNTKRIRELLTSIARDSPAFLRQLESDAIPAFTALLASSSQGLYGLRKIAHVLCSFLKPAPAEITRPFARSKHLMAALADAYDSGLATLARSYGGLSPARLHSASTPLDDWERVFLESKAALVDAAHALLATLLSDVAAARGPGAALAAAAASAFEVLDALVAVPPSRAPAEAPVPFLNRTLLEDCTAAYDLRAVLRDATRAASDPRGETLAHALDALDGTDGPGALRLIVRSSGAMPGIDARGAGAKGKAREAREAQVAAQVEEEDTALEAAVAQVLDILPEQDPAYVRYVLRHPDFPFRGDAERLLGALLEGTAPHVAPAQYAVAPVQTQVSAPERFEYTRERRNVFDEERLDVSRLRVGKKREDAGLQDRAFLEQMKADILRRAEEMDAEDEEEDDAAPSAKGKGVDVAVPEDLDELDELGGVKVRDGEPSEDEGSETDEGEEVAGTPAKPETILELAYIRDPTLFDRDAQTRRSKAREELKKQTGWGDEQIEGWRIMLERNPHKDKILQKHEFAGNQRGALAPSPAPGSSGGRGRGGARGRGGRGGGGGRGRGVGGGGASGSGGGGGGGGGDARDRAWKDKNKASRANHNRKRGHDKKMARAGGPS
ncbi:CUE domain-containing protein [Phanerochaete sordida]|uniref:CUE domain-containing protein n=1 Tax=Phanerochaete sordida TaxID=48140 RepID=A0A9P3LK93_9APHY|nr:CUE domain-containing protein [Phanerochaete sordida]